MDTDMHTSTQTHTMTHAHRKTHTTTQTHRNTDTCKCTHTHLQFGHAQPHSHRNTETYLEAQTHTDTQTRPPASPPHTGVQTHGHTLTDTHPHTETHQRLPLPGGEAPPLTASSGARTSRPPQTGGPRKQRLWGGQRLWALRALWTLPAEDFVQKLGGRAPGSGAVLRLPGRAALRPRPRLKRPVASEAWASPFRFLSLCFLTRRRGGQPPGRQPLDALVFSVDHDKLPECLSPSPGWGRLCGQGSCLLESKSVPELNSVCQAHSRCLANTCAMNQTSLDPQRLAGTWHEVHAPC